MAKKKEKWWVDVPIETQREILNEVPEERCSSCGQANKSFHEAREISRMRGNNFDIVKYRILGYCTFCDSYAQHTDYSRREGEVNGYGNSSPSRFGT